MVFFFTPRNTNCTCSFHPSTGTMQRRPARKKYNPRILPCPFKCGTLCRSASGLTQHRSVCSINPANRRASTPVQRLHTPITPTWTSPAFSSPLAGPRFQTPPPAFRNNQPPTPTSGSPLRYQWVENGKGLRTRIHPLLNGKRPSHHSATTH